jgi:hypothetical protein
MARRGEVDGDPVTFAIRDRRSLSRRNRSRRSLHCCWLRQAEVGQARRHLEHQMMWAARFVSDEAMPRAFPPGPVVETLRRQQSLFGISERQSPI